MWFFSPGGSFYHTFETLSGQALTAFFRLKSYLYKFTNITAEHKLNLFDKLILPILNYGSQVWGFSDSQTLELKFCKHILGVRSQTQNNFIYAESFRYPLTCYRIVNIVKYWFNKKCNDIKLLRLFYNIMLGDLNSMPDKPSWVRYLIFIFESLGFYHGWLFQGVGNENEFVSLLWKRSRDTFLQSINGQLKELPRASTYILFHNYGYKSYLNILRIQKYRHTLTRFRHSAHRLAIETGRWHKPYKIPWPDKKCQICDILEDEFHILFECTVFTELRKQYIKPYFWKRPNIIKFIELLCSENKTSVTNLSMCICKSFESRDINMSVTT